MKKNIAILLFIASFATMYSCKGKKTTANDTMTNTATTEQGEAKPAATATNETKTYTVTATPDSVLLGKNKEALVKIQNLKAVQLSNPDGDKKGIELTYDIEVTNNNKVGGGGIYINPNDFRLVLDNGNKLTHDNYNSVSADAESTKSSSGNKFILPAGTKPVALNLFFNDTNASVKLSME